MQVTVAEVYDTFTLGYDIKSLVFAIKLLNDHFIWRDELSLHFFNNGLYDAFFCLLLCQGWIRMLYAVLLCYAHNS